MTESYSDVFERLSPPPAAQQYYDLAGQALGSYANGTFNYDFNTDPVFQLMRQRYLKQGELNARDVAARAAALTGGYGNSYGTVAAQQAMTAANDNVNAIIPDLQNAAYARWADDQNRNLTLAQTYYQMANDEYDRAWQDKLHARQETEWGQQDEDRVRNNDWEDVLHGRQQEEWSQQDEDREYENNRRRIEDEHADIDWENGQKWNEISHALTIYQTTGDTSALEAAGLNADKMEYATALQQALSIYSATGALGPLKELGLDVSSAEAKAALEEAMAYAEYHDYSKLKELGIDTSYLEILDQLTLMAKYSSGGSGGGSGKGTGGNGDDVTNNGGGNGKNPMENFFGDEFSNFYVVGSKPTSYGQTIVYKNKDSGESWQIRQENGNYYVWVDGKWRKLDANGDYA